MQYIIIQSDFNGITTIAPVKGGAIIDIKTVDLSNYNIKE